jgi:hypothetical protein
VTSPGTGEGAGPAPPRATTFAATTPAGAGRDRDGSPVALANLALGRAELAFVAMLAIGEALAFGQDLVGGLARSPVTVARIGGLYVFGSLRVPLEVTATGSGVRGTFLEVGVALLTITAVGAVLLFRGGAAVGERAGGGLVRRVLWGAFGGLPFGLVCFLLSLVVGFRFRIPVIEGGQVAIGVSRPLAAVVGVAFGAALGLAGGAWSLLGDRSAAGGRTSEGVRLAGGAMAGAGRAFVAALGLSLAGLFVLAGLHPDATRVYFDRTVGDGTAGADLLVHHLLALPNQSMFVLVPALGGCDRVEGSTGTEAFLCLSTFPRHGRLRLVAPFEANPGAAGRSPFARVRFGPAPAPYLLFLLVPALATLAGGARAARGAGGRGEAAVTGALSGVGFAVLVVAGCVLAGVSIRFHGGSAPASLTIWPDPAGGGLLALGWGIVGGAVGAVLRWRTPARPPPLAASPAPAPEAPPAS